MSVAMFRKNLLLPSSTKQNSVQVGAEWWGGVSMSLTQGSCKDCDQSPLPFPVALIGHNSCNVPHNRQVYPTKSLSIYMNVINSG